MQTQTRFVQPVLGVIVDTSMQRPDAALALATLYSATTRGGLRVCSVCVTGSGLGAAILCDVIGRFYVPRVASSNTVLPVGLDASGTLPADSPMVKAAIDRKKADGGPQYVRGVQRVTDTSLAEAVLRNAVTLTTELVVVLSGPATSLARALELEGTKATVKQRVKRLVIADAGAARTDGPALKQLLADWPTPIFFCGHEVGEALPFPGARLDQLFTWAPAHPVVDAYRAFKAMPYDARCTTWRPSSTQSRQTRTCSPSRDRERCRLAAGGRSSFRRAKAASDRLGSSPRSARRPSTRS